ncbi:MAG: rRNA maturation RNase YbeY [Gammaproteobacteria bacterium]
MTAAQAMTFQLQVACGDSAVPPRARIRAWAHAALARAGRGGELTVRAVSESEMAALNHRYRGRAGATDVLAFPFAAEELPPAARAGILGDVVVCAPLAASQAARLRCAARDHWAHLVVHGTLHLCGYDHHRAAAAARMAAMERDILAGFGIAPPRRAPEE